MKKLFTASLLWLGLSFSAHASVGCILPFTLQNATLADATQVMANYNAIVTCLTNAAASGANNDITSLSGLSTPLSVTQGGTPTFIGGTSTGSANAQIVGVTNPLGFALNNGYRIIFKAGFTNTAATTLNVNSTGATNVFRRTTDGAQAMGGGEIISGTLVEAAYDSAGGVFNLMSNISPFPVGTVLDTIAAAADPGFMLMQGQCSSTTTFAALWVKMGSPAAGGCSAGNFALPDGRGRVVAMIDSGGSGRITVAGGNFDGTLLYNSGGGQNGTLVQSNLPNVTLGVTGTIQDQRTVTDTLNGADGAGAGTAFVRSNGGTATTHQLTFNSGVTASINGNVTSTTISKLPPIITLNKQVKY